MSNPPIFNSFGELYAKKEEILEIHPLCIEVSFVMHDNTFRSASPITIVVDV